MQLYTKEFSREHNKNPGNYVVKNMSRCLQNCFFLLSRAKAGMELAKRPKIWEVQQVKKILRNPHSPVGIAKRMRLGRADMKISTAPHWVYYTIFC